MKYPITSLECYHENGEEFTVDVCGYSGKVRHLILGPDALPYMRRHEVDVTDGYCEADQHCLASSCPLNHTPREHLSHMLEMWADEPLDEVDAKLCDTGSTIDALVKFADRLNAIVPKELSKGSGTKLEDGRKE